MNVSPILNLPAIGTLKLRRWQSSPRGWLPPLAVCLLPIIVPLLAYYGPVLRGGLSQLPAHGDAPFYIYQLSRCAELRGQWWQLGQDDMIGFPYPHGAAKNPSLYEGVDLLLLSSLTGRLLDPVVNYHVLMLTVLAANGWVAAWLVRRQTGSWFWAGVAAALISVNMSTAARLNGHLHLFKFFWVLLAVAGFNGWLDRPTVGRGLWLGVVTALCLQSSFYLGSFAALGFAGFGLIQMLAGRLTRAHITSAGAAVAAFVPVVVLFTLPVWTQSRSEPTAGAYFQRDWREAWIYGAELWQYVTRPGSGWGHVLKYGAARKELWESWHFPGNVVLLGLIGYGILRLRGVTVGEPTRFLDRAAGLILVWVLLSLRGGTSGYLIGLVPGIRCYGRAGLCAVALGCVAGPIVLHGLCQRIPWLWVRLAFCAAIVLMANDDINQGRRAFQSGPAVPPPAWVGWLAEQPHDVRLAALNLPLSPGDPWHWDSLHHRLRHRHATLNGAERAVLDDDLAIFGASIESMTPDGLTFIIALGYDTLAFDELYLFFHPWIRSMPGLKEIARRGEWTMYLVVSSDDASSMRR